MKTKRDYKMPKKLKKKYTFYDDVFSAKVIVNIGHNDMLDTKFRGNICLSDITEDNKTTREYIMNLEDRNAFYTLLHESLHLVKNIFQDRGMIFNAANDESIAYYQEYWFKKIWRAINYEK